MVTSDTGRIAIVVGGCFKAVACYPESVAANRVIYVDVVREIELVEPRASAGQSTYDTLIPVTLAKDKALRTLLWQIEKRLESDAGQPNIEPVGVHFKKLKTQLQHRNVPLEEGLAQIPALACFRHRTSVLGDLNN